MNKVLLLRSHVRKLINEAKDAGISVDDLVKIIIEEDEKETDSQKELSFREKLMCSLKSLRNLRYPYKEKTIVLPIFLQSQENQKYIVELLCIYNSKGVDNAELVHTKLRKEFAIRKEEIKKLETCLYKSLAMYYSLNVNKFMADESNSDS